MSIRLFGAGRAGLRFGAALVAVGIIGAAAFAQNLGPAETRVGNEASSALLLPNQFDPHLRLPAAQIAAATPIRFLTENDYPPFQITAPDGSLTGFNIDLARALCAELAHQCTIQPRRWDTLLDALASRAGDAIIAGMRPTPEILARADVTYPYLKTPGRFVARRDLALAPTPQTLSGHTVAVASGTAHEAFVKAFFPAATLRSLSSAGAVFDALARGEVDVAFVDGPSAASWLNSANGACCAFAGDPYFESRFFGEGMIIAVRKGDDAMRRVLNQALQRLSQNGRLGDIYLKYFPVGFY
ncbi:MAG: transporter substrate-binding domain-containing protein [Hyphomicrobiales bacterium]|nr:transporter substrate-binding domain-containing protein [Hyphomicrobiales bacterium]MBV9517167.1 transporter substrate-binding domain-containing protein [Hyphomicrobiales bacterium]